MTNTTSSQLPKFTAQWESPGGRPVLNAYRCPAGVVTIGHGATDRSPTFRKFWMAKRGHRLRMGDTITVQEADEALDLMLRNDYSPPVAKVMPDNISQHAFDASTDMSYNCGPGSLNWRWAKALAQGNITEAARLLRITATTANGKKLKGLVRRRDAEADLLVNGYRGLVVAPIRSESAEEVEQQQEWLKTLGYYKGDIDGIRGDLTRGAVKNFQRDKGLAVDGIVGPATTAAIIRALDAKRTNRVSTGSGVGGAGAAGVATADQTPMPDSSAEVISVAIDVGSVITYGIVVAAVVFIAFLVYRNRGRLFRTRRVPT